MPTEADCLDHIRRTFPDFELRNVQINQEGMVNVSVIVDGKRVFRFPRTQRSVGLQRHEMKVLDLLRHYVDMPVPDWDYRTDEMVSYPYIPGEPLLTDDVARMTEREQDAVAEALAVL